MAKEILDIVDDNGQPTGEVIDRVTAHRKVSYTGHLMCGW